QLGEAGGRPANAAIERRDRALNRPEQPARRHTAALGLSGIQLPDEGIQLRSQRLQDGKGDIARIAVDAWTHNLVRDEAVDNRNSLVACLGQMRSGTR